MTNDRIHAITADRLARWVQLCSEQHATPAALLAIGHDTHSGELHVFTLENFGDAAVLKLFQDAVALLQSKVN